MKKSKGVKLRDGTVVTKDNALAIMMGQARTQIRSMGLDPEDFDIQITGLESKENERCVRVKYRITPKYIIGEINNDGFC